MSQFLVTNLRSKIKTRRLKATGFVFVRGISLIEMIFVVAIISVILVTATRYFYTALNNQRINHTVSEIASLVSALQAWDPGNSDFSGLGNQGILNLYNAGFMAKTTDLVVTLGDSNGSQSTATLNNAWGSPINVSGVTKKATISTTLNTAAQCQSIANNFSGSSCSGANGFSYEISE
jgi:type II secretory pathway pseudopilin PulG